MLVRNTIAAAMLLTLAACGGTPEPAANTEAAAAPRTYKKGEVVDIDAKALTAEVLQNADAATKRYHDATMRVSGKVALVDHADRTGITVVTLEDGNLNSVMTSLAKGTPWRDVKVGQQRTFECTLMGAYLATTGFDGKCKPV